MYQTTFTYALCAFVAHRAFTEFFHSSRLVAVVCTSSHDLQPASCLFFSTVRHVVFRVYQWLDQPGDVLLALAPVHHQFSPTRYCHKFPFKMVNSLCIWFL